MRKKKSSQLNPASVLFLLRLLQSLVINNVNVKCYAEDTILYSINPSLREKNTALQLPLAAHQTKSKAQFIKEPHFFQTSC